VTPAKKKATAVEPETVAGATPDSKAESKVEAKVGNAEPQADELPADTAPAVGGGATATAPADARERFRQALEAKNARPGDHPGSQSSPGAHLKGSNSKRKREFRRKSG
jgi:hypothetical protein